jgi:hypothetical protein
MKTSTFYLLAAIVLGSRIAPKPLCAVSMVALLIAGIVAEAHGS